MKNIFFITAIILIIIWFVGILGFHAGGYIHILLIAGIAVILIKVLQPRNPR